MPLMLVALLLFGSFQKCKMNDSHETSGSKSITATQNDGVHAFSNNDRHLRHQKSQLVAAKTTFRTHDGSRGMLEIRDEKRVVKRQKAKPIPAIRDGNQNQFSVIDGGMATVDSSIPSVKHNSRPPKHIKATARQKINQMTLPSQSFETKSIASSAVEIVAKPTEINPQQQNVPYNISTICFYSNSATERGVEAAMYDYAHYAEVLFGVKSRIIFPRFIEHENSWTATGDERRSLPKFQSRFNVSFCGEEYSEDFRRRFVNRHKSGNKYVICPDLASVALSLPCHVLYVAKSGARGSDPKYPESFKSQIPTAVHAVFEWQRHGTTYAAISPSVVGKKKGPDRPIVPHMVIAPDASFVNSIEDFHREFEIPAKALVLCRHGSSTTFDIPYLIKAISRAVSLHGADRLHFIFLGGLSDNVAVKLTTNTSQIHHIAATTSALVKERFFKSCDAMIHARSEGETFGLAIADFSIRNKPVITQSTAPPEANMHLKILGSKGLYYSDEDSVLAIIAKLITEKVAGVKPSPDGSLNAYAAYAPEKVMAIFKEVFLDPIGILTPYKQTAS